MSAAARELTRADILPSEDYASIRKERRRAVAAIKRDRRIEVGPFTTFYFENYETMWHQVHEMLHIEKGGEAQIEGELAAYNPLIPKGRELVATLMFEIEEPARRARLLAGLGGVEHTVRLEFAGAILSAVPESEVARTNEAGKASAVHFLRFPFDDAQADAFRATGARVTLAIGHATYAHMAILPERVRTALGADLD
jgi:hypothetical protein